MAFRTGRRESVIFMLCVQNGRIASLWFGTRMVQIKPKQKRIVVIEYEYWLLTTLQRGEAMKKQKVLSCVSGSRKVPKPN